VTVLVVLETIALGLLAVLVAGLLRSHAEILRLLHHLGADYMGDAGPAPTLAPMRPTGTAADLAGVTAFGDAVVVGLSNPDSSALLLFLSTGCEKCTRFLESIAAGAHRSLGTRVLVVTRGPDQESVGQLRTWQERGVEIVMSSAAWDDFRTPGSPYVVYCSRGHIVGEGTAGSWGQIESLVTQAQGDIDAATAARPSSPRDAALARARDIAQQASTDAEREHRNDEELRAAGIEPGDPRLYPRLPDEAA
jgi:hypothetical protein